VPIWYTWKNDAVTTLASELLAGAVSCVVTDGTKLPSTFPFTMTIWDADTYRYPGDDPGAEIVLVTNRVTTTCTITRGQEGTADVTHDAGETAANLITAAGLKQITDDVDLKLPLAGGELSGDVTCAGEQTVDTLDLSAHAHTGEAGHGVKVAHTSLTSIGTNTHAGIDTALGAIRDGDRGILIARIRDICGTNIKGLWFFNPTTGITLTDRSGNAHNGTLTADAATLTPGFAGNAPYLTFAGATSTAPYWSAADHADFTFGNSSTDNPFSIVVLSCPSDVTGCGLLGKRDYTTGSEQREWTFSFGDDDKLYGILVDNSTGGTVSRSYGTALTAYENQWVVLAMTYDGTRTHTGVSLYLNGTAIDDTGADSSYTAMENTTANIGPFRILSTGVVSNRFRGLAGVTFITAEEISAANVLTLSRWLLGYAGQL
jgi:hypothetical protein